MMGIIKLKKVHNYQAILFFKKYISFYLIK